MSITDRGRPVVSCSEWHEDGTARENDRGSDLTATVPARAMGEARPGRHKLVGSPPQQGAAALTLTAGSWLNPRWRDCALCLRGLWVVLVADVVNGERLVRDEQEGAVLILGSPVLHDSALREPYEASGRILTLVGVEGAFEHIDAVGARVAARGS